MYSKSQNCCFADLVTVQKGKKLSFSVISKTFPRPLTRKEFLTNFQFLNPQNDVLNIIHDFFVSESYDLYVEFIES